MPLMKKPLPHLVLSLIIAVALSACSPVGMATGAGASVGVAAFEERGLEQSATDQWIEIEISRLLFEQHVDELFRPLNIAVHEGRVLLTGSLKDQDLMVKAIQTAWAVKGVKEVINEVRVGDPLSQQQVINDNVIAANLKSRLLFKRDIQSINYNIEVDNGVVYILGIGQDQAEVDRVVGIASTLPRVKRVVNYAVLKGQRVKPAPSPISPAATPPTS